MEAPIKQKNYTCFLKNCVEEFDSHFPLFLHIQQKHFLHSSASLPVDIEDYSAKELIQLLRRDNPFESKLKHTDQEKFEKFVSTLCNVATREELDLKLASASNSASSSRTSDSGFASPSVGSRGLTKLKMPNVKQVFPSARRSSIRGGKSSPGLARLESNPSLSNIEATFTHVQDLETPDISRLVGMEAQQNNTPRTADILNSVLELDREGQQSRTLRNGKKTNSPSKMTMIPAYETADNVVTSSGGTILLPVAAHQTVASSEEEGEHEDDQDLEPQQPVEKQNSGAGGRNTTMQLALKIGGQSINIPLQIALGANKQERMTPTRATAGPSAVLSGGGGMSGISVSSIRKRNAAPFLNHPGTLPLDTHDQVDASFDDSFGTSQYIISEDNHFAHELTELQKRQEILERNKAAAVRYRAKKKDEQTVLRDQMIQLQQDKVELQAQLSVLRGALSNVVDILEEHRNCPVTHERQHKIPRLSDPAHLAAAALRSTEMIPDYQTEGNKIVTSSNNLISGGSTKLDGHPGQQIRLIQTQGDSAGEMQFVTLQPVHVQRSSASEFIGSSRNSTTAKVYLPVGSSATPVVVSSSHI